MTDQRPQSAARFDNVSVRYAKENVLNAVSFSVNPGSVLAILGRNGTGKSSLIRCLLGLQSPFEGRVALLDRDPGAGRVELMARIGVVPEEPDAPVYLTALQLTELCAALNKRCDVNAVRAQLSRMRIPTDVAFGSLSRGQKTSTMLALALGHQPELLILDDPTLGLDAVTKKVIIDELIATLAARGITVIIATHDLATVERFADAVVILGRGRVLASEPIESLKTRFRRLRGPKDARFEPFQVVSEATHAWGREAIVSDFSEERFEAWRAGALESEALSVSLEEIFVALAGEGVAA